MKRWALRGVWVLGIVIASVMGLVTATLLVLQTEWGGERLRRQAVAATNQQIKGRLDIGRLSYGGNSLTVWGVKLFDPEGALVGEIRRAKVEVSFGGLLHQEIRVTAIEIEEPRLSLVSDSRGLNLSRATAPRKETPAPDEPKKPSRTDDEGWVLRLDRFDLTSGDVTLATAGVPSTSTAAPPGGGTAGAGTAQTRVHLTKLRASMTARYGTGNGSFKYAFGLTGQSLLPRAADLAFKTDGDGKVGGLMRLAADGRAGEGTLKARTALDSERLQETDAELVLYIPKTDIAGFAWGPVRIDALANRGQLGKLDLLIEAPGLDVRGKGGPDKGDGDKGDRDQGKAVSGAATGKTVAFDARVALADLGLTGRAVAALTGSVLPPLDGRGHLDLSVAGPLVGAPASLRARVAGGFDRLRSGDTALEGIKLTATAAHLSADPGQAALDVAIASVVAGTSRFAGIGLEARVRGQELAADVKIAEPLRVALLARGSLDADRQGLSLGRLELGYPGGSWASEGTARLRFGGDRLSLAAFRLVSAGQALALDAAKAGQQVEAHLAVEKLRLDLLPAFAVDRKLRLGGVVDADVRVAGVVENPSVKARVRVAQARFRRFSRIDAALDATVAEHVAAGTLSVDAPTLATKATFKLPAAALTPNDPVELRVDVTRLELAETMRAAGVKAPGDGTLDLHLQLTGSAGAPELDFTLNGRRLQAHRPATEATSAETISVGRAKVHMVYGQRQARARIDLASSSGGTLRVDANARVDLSYPRVLRGLAVEKIPLRGKMVARDFDVAWVAGFNQQLETLAGKLNARASLTGTIDDPRFVGDFRWKDGKVIANTSVPLPPGPVGPGSQPTAPPSGKVGKASLPPSKPAEKRPAASPTPAP